MGTFGGIPTLGFSDEDAETDINFLVKNTESSFPHFFVYLYGIFHVQNQNP